MKEISMNILECDLSYSSLASSDIHIRRTIVKLQLNTSLIEVIDEATNLYLNIK